MTDLHVSLPHLDFKNFISILFKYFKIWKHGSVCVHIRLELSLDLAGICEIRTELSLKYYFYFLLVEHSDFPFVKTFQPENLSLSSCPK